MSKHTAIRRSTLVSSIAMLLVAVMALSGATYAWFSNNTNTKAEGIKLTAAAVSGLFIAEDDINFESRPGTAPNDPTVWKGSINWNVTATGMGPASCAFNTWTPSFYFASSDNEAGTITSEVTEASSSNYIAKKIWVKTEDSEATTLQCAVNITAPENTENKGYERVAIINATTGSTIVKSGNQQNCWVVATSADTAEALASTTPTYETVDAIADGSYVNVATNFSNAQAQCFYVYVWFEGQDTDCKNAKSGAGLDVSVDFKTAKTA